jgi:hypothetical protein
MKIHRFLLLSAAVCFAFFPAAAATLNTNSAHADADAPIDLAAPEAKFDPVIDDLPLMSGLTAEPDQGALFTAPRAGRIAESVASGEVDIDDVYRFYQRTLPHLGWKPLDARSYKRNGEKLRIDAHADGKTTTVHFSIKPE